MPSERAKREIDRRQYLQYAGAAAASATVAGCMGDDEEPEEQLDDDDTADDDPYDDDDRDDDEPEDEEFDVTITQGQFAQTLDPMDHNDTPTWNVVDQAYDPLLYRDREGEIIDYLATDYERLDDDLVRFELRDHVVFHSGNEMTPEDVAYSINRTIDEDVGIVSPQADTLPGIDEAVAADDGNAIEVHLETINPVVFNNFASFGRVVEEEWVEERDNEIATEMNGTGPYQLVDFEDEVAVEYEKFDEYWGDEPDPERVTFTAAGEDSTRVNQLITGETDLVVNVPPSEVSRIEDEGEAQVEFVPSTRVIFLVMPNDEPPFDSEEFRQAMNYAVDVEGIVAEILEEFGSPISQPTVEGHAGHDPDLDPYGYDPERAEELVEESGHEGVEITLETPQGRYLGDADVARAAASQIDELDNVNCEVDLREFASMEGEISDGDLETAPDFFLIGWGNPTFDADYTLNPWFTPGAFQHFEDEETQELIAEAEETVDEDDRIELLQDANRRLHELAPWVFLHQQYGIYGISDRIDWEARADEDIIATEIEQP